MLHLLCTLFLLLLHQLHNRSSGIRYWRLGIPAVENRTPLMKGHIFYYIGLKFIPLFITAGSMVQPPPPCFLLNHRCSLTEGGARRIRSLPLSRSHGGIAGIYKARLSQRASEIQPSAFSSCCMMLSLLKDSPSPNTEYNNPIESIANDKLCTDK